MTPQTEYRPGYGLPLVSYRPPAATKKDPEGKRYNDPFAPATLSRQEKLLAILKKHGEMSRVELQSVAHMKHISFDLAELHKQGLIANRRSPVFRTKGMTNSLWRAVEPGEMT